MSKLWEAICLSFNAFYKQLAAFRPTEEVTLICYDLYPPVKVVFFFKGAVPPLTNSYG